MARELQGQGSGGAQALPEGRPASMRVTGPSTSCRRVVRRAVRAVQREICEEFALYGFYVASGRA